MYLIKSDLGFIAAGLFRYGIIKKERKFYAIATINKRNTEAMHVSQPEQKLLITVGAVTFPVKYGWMVYRMNNLLKNIREFLKQD